CTRVRLITWSFLRPIVLSLPALAAGQAVLADERAAGMLEEITVSAQRREESLLGVPNAVTVIGPAVLERGTARTLEDMQQSVPGLSVERIQGYGNLVIRG